MIEPTLISAAPGLTELSTMIAVKPRPEEAAAIAATDGDIPENLHVTLAYLGEYDGELEQIADALRIVAATHAPLEGSIAGYGIFAGADGDPWPAILLPDVPGLVELRVDATEALARAGIDYSRSHGFAAHVTLDYVESAPAMRGGDGPFRPDQAGAMLHFDELLIVRSDSEVVAMPLTGAKPLTAALTAAGEPFCLPAELRGKTDPIREAFVKAVMTPALEQAGLKWDITNPLAADVISRAGAHIVGIAQTTQDDLMNVINVAHDQGLSIPDTAKAIRSHMAEASNVRATMIARTELAAAVNGGSLAATKLAAEVTQAITTKTWMTAPGAVYPRHEDYEGLDGQTVGLDELFDVGGEDLRYPGDPDGDPGETINCFPGSTLVAAIGETRAGFRRRYRGSLVRIETDRGHVLAGTPNHPVLTSAGWKALRLVSEGDYLVCGDPIELVAVAAPDVDDAPTPIHQIVSALASSGLTRRIGGSAVQFHGDAVPDGEVEVVTPNRALRLGYDSAPLEPERQQLLIGADEVDGALATSRSSGEVGFGASHATDGIMRCARETTALIGVGLSHSDTHRGRAIARFDSEREQTSADSWTPDAVAFGQSLLGGAGEVAVAKVLKIDEYAFEGDVFNIQTETGTYLANGVIVHNCRCTLEYSHKESDLAGDNIDAAGAPRFSIAHHNRLLRKAYERVDELEPKLAAILQPILERAGDIAARRFEQLATNHLTAADDPANPAGWTPPAAEEILPVNCEELAGARGLTSGDAEVGLKPLAAPSAGPGPGRSVVSFAETTDYEAFNSALAENARPGFLTVHTPEELARDKVFISPDGESGFVVTPEHDLQNVFRNPGGVKGAGQQAVRKAVQEEGATTLDAYDGFLPDLYEQEGFRIVGRMKFIDEYAPEGWKFDEYGRPDIVFMAQNAPADTEIRLFTDWDKAKAYAESVAGDPIPPEILDSAKEMISQAAAVEPEVTAELSGIADSIGGKMEGLANAVKANPSLVRKITGDLADARLADASATVQEVSASINDVLRYTMTFSDSSYTGGVEQTLMRLERDGYTQIKLKNYWGNADYQGINGVFEKNGQRFELQFHTPRTFELKTELHSQYRAFQMSTDPAERLRLWNEMAAEQSKNPVPNGAFAIGQRVTHEAPPGATMRARTVQDFVPGANNLTRDRTMENINYVAEHQAQTQGGRWKMVGTPQERSQLLEEWKAEALASIKKAVADAQVRIRVKADTLEKVIEDGRFKSQFETGSSKGMFDPDMRVRAEERMFGYPKSLPDEERPIYGYIAGSAREAGGVEQYGDLIVNLKPETNERTTFSLIDSLGPGRDGEIIPSPLNDPSLTSWWGGSNPVEANGDIGNMTYGSYSEAQIHGGVALSDIDEIIFSAEKEQEAIEGSAAMANIMRERLAEAEAELERRRVAVAPSVSIAEAEDLVERAREQADEWLAISEQQMMEGVNLRERLDELEIRWHMVDTYRNLGGGNSDNN